MPARPPRATGVPAPRVRLCAACTVYQRTCTLAAAEEGGVFVCVCLYVCENLMKRS